MSRQIYLITHGQKAKGPNPSLTSLGVQQVRLLKPYLPKQIHTVVCGVGRRHLKTARELGLEPDRYSGIVGVAESKNYAADTVILADGTEIPAAKYSAVTDRAESFTALVNDLPSRSVVITSRSMVKRLGTANHPKEAAVYRYKPDAREIKELFAASEDIGEGDQEV
ncbi:MAG: hypothetical protein A3J62_03080 [Candidatus Buchananbacteria bacterium RIFCSPHIGHO2_02_FULL_38_8]|uniref:Phosphoglycerate mutase n=1 Tax=Candidatus Buchananbacteria bacterium RIFCSPHIGHO2_02_FULL_38_8 TaxID=1797538 RepID=A0A1G1Y5S8_9BACT|nr:MAG: hypothetical protein A3J62_03080 [Candidatus Buchananbacteria bacterium RIFCSPHIGHO2_02_FULL_38_8]